MRQKFEIFRLFKLFGFETIIFEFQKVYLEFNWNLQRYIDVPINKKYLYQLCFDIKFNFNMTKKKRILEI